MKIFFRKDKKKGTSCFYLSTEPSSNDNKNKKTNYSFWKILLTLIEITASIITILSLLN